MILLYTLLYYLQILHRYRRRAMNQTQRILTILKKLSINSGKTPVNTKDIAEEYYKKNYSENEKSAMRMAQDDMKLIKTLFEKDIVCVKRGCYIFENEELARSFFKIGFDSDEYKKFFEFIILFDDILLDSIADERLKLYIKKLKKDKEQVYTIKANPIEELPNKDIMDQLKKAVLGRRYINLTVYDDDNLLTDNNNKEEFLKNIQPHRIVFTEGNWYLAIYDKNMIINNGFRFLRIGKIIPGTIDITSNTFQKNRDIEEHLQNFQSIFSYFKKEPFKVVLKISKNVSKFFLHKKFLASQTIVNTFDDGSLEIHYLINNEMEILLLAKKWLPDIEILSPSWLKEIYYRDLSKMLATMTQE